MKSALIVLPTDDQGGAEKIASMVARFLAETGSWAVTVAVLSRSKNNMRFDQLPDSVRLIYGSGSGRVGSELRLLKLLTTNRFDLAFSTHIRINAFLCLARRLGLLRCRRLVTRESTVMSDRFTGLRIFICKLAYLTYGVQDMTIVQTYYMKAKLSQYLAASESASIRVLGNPVETTSKVYSRAMELLSDGVGREDALVWCGRFVPVKRPYLAIEVLRLLHARGMAYRLVMVGDGPLRAAVQEELNGSELAEFVSFTGEVQDPVPFFECCRYGLITSLSEGFPNVLLEMLAAGVDAVHMTPCTGDVGDLPRVSVASGFSAEQLVASIVEGDKLESNDVGKLQHALMQRSPQCFVEQLVGEPLAV